MMAIRFSTSRFATRTAACERDENYIQRRWDAHSATCPEHGRCYVDVLENELIRRVHFGIEPREEQSITRISLSE